jgi:hypothetical protein
VPLAPDGADGRIVRRDVLAGIAHDCYREAARSPISAHHSVRRECLDHLLVLGEAHLRRILKEYVSYFNFVRPDQGLQQRIPDAPKEDAPPAGPVRAIPVLGGLHHTYRRAA